MDIDQIQDNLYVGSYPRTAEDVKAFQNHGATAVVNLPSDEDSLGDGKIYIGTRDGQVGVVSAEGNWRNLHMANLCGEIEASPAIADGRVYIRTDKAIYCFGLKSEQ